ncbi:MAG: glycoside hydrolase family 130 protein [Clostridium sp.]|nr:glycoside hydrolase family 130 protein [Clostridium sp.]MCH3962909.1 glycoside hydrolase family 130 protein [Clostridium sp.]MCI1715676.1 glycoside hydrolase family 130 protein [Clostridium sp.]MCI1800119.1 glycoside hydrolase family 130 protein [Clostridium sp.]MCI1814033.1 glycoside hydrolase family 130 protein [Clostridium sp.]MCI2200115.1 glycoside hydrolase family 130 protein [Clostridium sp.]
MSIKRYGFNPIIKAGDVEPSCKNLKVVGAFNPGAAIYKDQIILAFRTAEAVDNPDDDFFRVPIVDSSTSCLKTVDIDKSNRDYDFSDSRVIKNIKKPYDFEYLTSISHIRLARSDDGINFDVDERPFIFPENKYESFGIEDPRITRIDSSYYITYSGVSKYGIVVGLAVTEDFKSYRKLGNIFNTENKDAVIFPEKIGGKYFALNRPVSRSTGKPMIWISESDNLINWGNHRLLACTRENCWDSRKIGAGMPPIRTDAGWLELYHGVDEHECYSMGALLLDLDDPSKVIGRSEEPVLYPCEDYETEGFFSDVVFPCGAVEIRDKLYIYYGIADSSIGLVTADTGDILNSIGVAGEPQHGKNIY